jgi:histone-lysine N-methyltransferase MLL2
LPSSSVTKPPPVIQQPPSVGGTQSADVPSGTHAPQFAGWVPGSHVGGCVQVTPPLSFGVHVHGGPPPAPLELAPPLEAPLLVAPLLEVGPPPEVVPPLLVEVVPLLEPPCGLRPLPELLGPLDDVPLLLPPGGTPSEVLPLEPPLVVPPDVVPPEVVPPEVVPPEVVPLLVPLDDEKSDVEPPEALPELPEEPAGGQAGLKSP